MSYIDNRLIAVFLTSQLGAHRWPRTEKELDRFVNDLLHADWDANDGPIRLSRDLTLAQVAGSRLFDHVRIFVRTLAEAKGAKLTKNGYLSRADIARLVERMPWPRRTVDYALRVFHSRKFDEMDVLPIFYIRTVSDCAGLTVKRRDRLLAPKKGLALCEDDRAGELFRHLFITWFRRVSFEYLFNTPGAPLLQTTIAVILWRLSLTANDWIASEALPPEVLHPAVRVQMPSGETWPGGEEFTLAHRVLEPLTWFGLLECDIPDDSPGRNIRARKFRKTQLFDQFLGFVWKP